MFAETVSTRSHHSSLGLFQMADCSQAAETRQCRLIILIAYLLTSCSNKARGSSRYTLKPSRAANSERLKRGAAPCRNHWAGTSAFQWLGLIFLLAASPPDPSGRRLLNWRSSFRPVLRTAKVPPGRRAGIAAPSFGRPLRESPRLGRRNPHPPGELDDSRSPGFQGQIRGLNRLTRLNFDPVRQARSPARATAQGPDG